MVKPSIKYITSADLFSIHFVPTLIVFVVMMVLIGFSWRTASQAIIDAQNQQVNVRSQFIESNIIQRLNTNDNALRSGAGLFESSDQVTRDEWRQFVTSLDVTGHLPAMIGLGYVEMIGPAELDAYEARIRAEGFPDFNIRPATPARDTYSSITYIEPFDERNQQAFGGDMLTEENRRTAMERARDEGVSTITDTVSVLQPDGSRQNGITMFHPIYRPGVDISTVEARRQALVGYIYAPLRSTVLFGNIFRDSDENLNIQVYDGDTFTPETLLYERFDAESGEPFTHIKDSQLQVDGQVWTVRYSVRSGIVPAALRNRPGNVALGGIVFSLLVAGLVYLLLQRRSRILVENENKKLDSAKDSMLSLASHQLRTPATGVKQYLGMVLEGFVGDITDDQKELLQRANDSNERQLRIINEFLYLAKADAGRIVISPQTFDIGDLADSIVAEMQTEISQAGHQVTVRRRAKAINVYADPHSARMIIENLLSNAIKYTPAGGKIIVTVTKRRTMACVSVQDNGVGIAHRDFGKLFKQFSRIPNELSRQEAGSGIGLYLADYLAELNGGKISVESKRHRGSTFTVQLPVRAVRKVTAT